MLSPWIKWCERTRVTTYGSVNYPFYLRLFSQQRLKHLKKKKAGNVSSSKNFLFNITFKILTVLNHWSTLFKLSLELIKIMENFVGFSAKNYWFWNLFYEIHSFILCTRINAWFHLKKIIIRNVFRHVRIEDMCNWQRKLVAISCARRDMWRCPYQRGVTAAGKKPLAKNFKRHRNVELKF